MIARNARVAVCATALSISAIVCGCATAPGSGKAEVRSVPAAPEVAVSSTRFRKEYVLAPEDTLDVVVLQHPEVSQSCVIRPDGNISLPMLDDVPAAGLTPRELDAKITEGLSGRVLNPEVTVVVTHYRPPSAYVMGEVARPTAVPLRDASTVLQAIARCGDFTGYAAKDSVILVRLDDSEQLVASRLNVTDVKGRDKAYLALNNVPLKADDLIFVPKTSVGRLSTYLTQNITPILGAFNAAVGTVTNVKYINLIDKQVEWLEKETERLDNSTITPTFVNPTPAQ